MFTPVERERLRSVLIELARGDDRITGGAITGASWRTLQDARAMSGAPPDHEVLTLEEVAVSDVADVTHHGRSGQIQVQCRLLPRSGR